MIKTSKSIQLPFTTPQGIEINSSQDVIGIRKKRPLK
jgi:hypothetical protein